MVNPSLVLSGLSFLTSMQSARAVSEATNRAQNGDTGGDMPSEVEQNERIVSRQDKVIDRLEALYAVEAKNKPTASDKDAFASATVTLSSGETALVTVEPQTGYNLRVKEIHFDRRDDHSYELNVGGDVTSVSHRAKYVSPKLVSQSDRVIAQVTNNSGSTTTLDFEMEAWAERP